MTEIYYREDITMKLKRTLACGSFVDRRRIMSEFYTGLDNSVMEKDCIGLCAKVYPDWLGYLTLPDIRNYLRYEEKPILQKQRYDKEEADHFERIRMYYSTVMEYQQFNTLRNDLKSIIYKGIYFTDDSKLRDIRNKIIIDGPVVMSEISMQLDDQSFMDLMKITHPLFIDKMMSFYYNCSFDELCMMIETGFINKKIFKKYDRYHGPDMYNDLHKGPFSLNMPTFDEVFLDAVYNELFVSL